MHALHSVCELCSVCVPAVVVATATMYKCSPQCARRCLCKLDKDSCKMCFCFSFICHRRQLISYGTELNPIRITLPIHNSCSIELFLYSFELVVLREGNKARSNTQQQQQLLHAHNCTLLLRIAFVSMQKPTAMFVTPARCNVAVDVAAC